uniref:F-box domain-containing protein n=1 Tax=Angiostrongylus cantonensis TaxID=6313 RepID=A0A0K0CTS2_ANGCA
MASSIAALNEERMKAFRDAADKALAVIKSRFDAKQRELEEYDSLIHCLEELPKKRERAIMCPVGSVGFLPATIVHTNEVLVGLGDGYFIDTTAFDAIEILKRRKTVIDKNISDLHQYENIIIQQMEFAKQLFDNNSDEVEIREEYDEAKENELRSMWIISKLADMMKRLEELELQEMRNAELDLASSDEMEVDRSTLPIDVLRKLDEGDTKCLISTFASKEAAESSALSRNPNIQISVVSPQSSNDGEPHKDSTTLTPIEAVASTSNECNAEKESVGVSLEREITPDVSRWEDVVRTLEGQREVYVPDAHCFQPPPGIRSEVSGLVESMNSDESDSDWISEESENDLNNEGIEHMEHCMDEGSELDSDDITFPDVQGNNFASHLPSKKARLGECVVQNVGLCGPLLDRTDDDQKHAQLHGPQTETFSRTEKARGDEGKTKMKEKKREKKNVTFAENLENATLIDKQAPPSEVQSLTTSSSGTIARKILSNCDERSPIDKQGVEQMNSGGTRYNFQDTSTAFTGVFQERNLDREYTFETVVFLLTTDSVPEVTEEREKRKEQSLFKMRRLHNNSPELPMEWADPQTLFYSEIIASYEDECRNNSDLAVEKLVLLLSRLPPIGTVPQSGRSPIVELEESLSSLPQQCLLGRLPGVVLLRIIGLLPMTTMLSLACTCKTFNSIINEQQHNLKNLDFREDRIIMIAVRRAQNDSFDQVERYLHCSEVEIDNKLEQIDGLVFGKSPVKSLRKEW